MLAKKNRDEEISYQADDSSYGNRCVEIIKTQLTDSDKQEKDYFRSGDAAEVSVTLKANRDTPDVTVGIAIRDRFGQDVFGINSYHLNNLFFMGQKTRRTIVFSFDQLNIGPGQYTLTVAVHSGETHLSNCYHWMDNAKQFEVVSGDDFLFTGLVKLYPELIMHEE